MNFDSADRRFRYDSEYSLINRDDDLYGVVVEWTDSLKTVTSEMGASATARARLLSKPSGSVVLTALVTKAAEASVTPPMAVLGPDTWDIGECTNRLNYRY